MWELNQIVCAGYLCGLSVLDIRSRKMPVWLLACGVGSAFLYQVIAGGQQAVLCVAGAAVGGIFLAVSKITGEAFGYGDSILIFMLGIYLGLWDLLCLLMVSFSLAAGVSVVMLLAKHFRRKTTIPFVPFLCAGYLITFLMGGA